MWMFGRSASAPPVASRREARAGSCAVSQMRGFDAPSNAAATATRSSRKNVDSSTYPIRSDRSISQAWRASRLAFGNVFAHDAFVSLQLPLMIRPLGEPVGDADLRIDRTGSHGDARLITGGNDLFQTELAIAENGDESNEHGDLR